MKSFKNKFHLWSLLLLMSACGSDLLPKYTILQSLRVLTLVSDLPEIGFDGTSFTSNVVITPVISDLYGSGRALKYNLEWCIDPGIALGAIPTCVGNLTRTIVQSGASVSSTGGSTFVTPNFTGTVDSTTVDFSTANAGVLTLLGAKYASLSSAQLYNGMSLLLIYEIYPDGDESSKVSSLKRIILSSSAKATKNVNPTGLEIRKSGVEISSLPTIESELEAYLAASQAESYLLKNSDGSFTSKSEVLETTWFLTGPSDIECSKKKECNTDGLFLMSRTRLGEMNTFYVPEVSLPTSRGRVLMAVARDDRGGVVVKRYCTGTCP